MRAIAVPRRGDELLHRPQLPACLFERLTQRPGADLDRLAVRASCEAQDNPSVLLLGRGKQTIVLPQFRDA